MKTYVIPSLVTLIGNCFKAVEVVNLLCCGLGAESIECASHRSLYLIACICCYRSKIVSYISTAVHVAFDAVCTTCEVFKVVSYINVIETVEVVLSLTIGETG